MRTINEARWRYAKQIVGFNLSLIVISILYYLLGGFDLKEFSALIAILVSVSAIYFGALFQFLGRRITEEEQAENEPEGPEDWHVSTSFTEIAAAAPGAEKKAIPGKWKAFLFLRWIIPLHFLLLVAIISLKAFTQITAQEMNVLLTLVEGAFGGYMGYLINAIFKIPNS